MTYDVHARALAVARRLAWLPPLLARVSVGGVFLGTGWGKLQDLERVVAFFRSLGIPAPELQAPFVAATELGCGLLLLVGLGTRLAALPLAATMLVAIRTALWPELAGSLDLLGRTEWLLLVTLVWLAIAGPGPVSLDAPLARRLGRGGCGATALPPRRGEPART